jgi:hypothetical protein
MKEPKGYNKRAWDWSVRQARKDKAWAMKEKQNKKFMKSSSNMTQEMANEYSLKSTREIAKDHYDYLKFRANAKGKIYGRDAYIDEQAREKWLKLTEKTGKKKMREIS